MRADPAAAADRVLSRLGVAWPRRRPTAADRLARVEDELRFLRLAVETWANETRSLRRQSMSDASAQQETLSDVLDLVRRTQGRTESLITLNRQLADKLDQAQQDPEMVAQIASELRSLDQQIVEAIEANPGDEDEGTGEQPGTGEGGEGTPPEGGGVPTDPGAPGIDTPPAPGEGGS